MRVTTRVFPDGGLQRTLRLEARDPARTEPYPADWLAVGPGLVIADRQAWDTVEAGATSLRAEGYFAAGEKVPPLLGHRDEEGERPDRGQVTVSRDDLVVLDRFLYEETLGDPYGAPELASHLSALLAHVATRLRQELRRQFGPDVVTTPAEGYVTQGARAVLLDLLTALRETEPPGKRAQRPKAFEEVHARHDLPLASGDAEQAIEADVRALMDRVAAEVVRANPRLDAAALTAFVAGESGVLSRILEEREAQPAVEGVQRALLGAYGLGARTRFVFRVTLPGRVLRTGGTVDGEAVVFRFDQDDVAAKDAVLQAESVEPNTEALTRLGARRDLDAETLLRLTGLLTRPDLGEPLRAGLARAVQAGKLALLREGLTGEGVQEAGTEIADLLDPSRPAWPPP
ncbi:MAG TPA: hypothetical protein VFV75_15655 [Candidatus Polarisedimenticolaceae bacterium]|nr:hypothetical protein [Candidatus Polarisedimenticolaceae bacterium]